MRPRELRDIERHCGQLLREPTVTHVFILDAREKLFVSMGSTEPLVVLGSVKLPPKELASILAKLLARNKKKSFHRADPTGPSAYLRRAENGITVVVFYWDPALLGTIRVFTQQIVFELERLVPAEMDTFPWTGGGGSSGGGPLPGEVRVALPRLGRPKRWHS